MSVHPHPNETPHVVAPEPEPDKRSALRSERVEFVTQATLNSKSFKESVATPFSNWIVDACTLKPMVEIQHQFCQKKVLFLFGITNQVRIWNCRLVSLKVFDWFMLGAILANCVTPAMGSNRPGFSESTTGQALIMSNYVFVAVFTIEFITKVMAYGFLLEPKTYLRNGWNILDFIVLITAFLEFTSVGSSSTAIRSARVLRPLRTITKIEELRIIVLSVIKSIPMMVDVFVLTLFYLSIFGIACVQLFMGKLKNRCGVASFDGAYTTNLGDVEVWDAHRHFLSIFGIATFHLFMGKLKKRCGVASFDGAYRKCLGDIQMFMGKQNIRFGVASFDGACTTSLGDVQNVTYTVLEEGWVSAGPLAALDTWSNTSGTPEALSVGSTPQGHVCRWEPDASNDSIAPYGYFSVPYGNPEVYRDFDNILYAWLAIFQHIIPEDWSMIMHNTMDGVSFWK
eukprot:gene11748-34474_t